MARSSAALAVTAMEASWERRDSDSVRSFSCACLKVAASAWAASRVALDRSVSIPACWANRSESCSAFCRRSESSAVRARAWSRTEARLFDSSRVVARSRANFSRLLRSSSRLRRRAETTSSLAEAGWLASGAGAGGSSFLSQRVRAKRFSNRKSQRMRRRVLFTDRGD